MLAFREIARFTDIPESTVNYWHGKGFIPESDDMGIIVRSIVAYLKRQIEEKQKKKDDKNDYFAEKTRLTSAQADKVELENAVRSGELFEARECERVWANYIGNCRARLLSMPTKLAPELAAVSDPLIVEGILRSTIYEALRELSGIEFEGKSGESEPIDSSPR
jgi:hypothetical protein